MKKTLALLLALMLILSLSALAFADEAPADEPNSAESSTDESPVVDKEGTKATPGAGDLIHFIPTTIDVTSQDVVVKGYFVNLNTDRSVGSFRDYKMDVYVDGDYIIGGNFGTIHDFTIKPLGVVYQSFTFTGSHRNLSNGSYVCDDTCYCITGFKFTSSN